MFSFKTLRSIWRICPITCGWFIGYFATEVVWIMLDPYYFLSSVCAFKMAVGAAIALIIAFYEIRKKVMNNGRNNKM